MSPVASPHRPRGGRAGRPRLLEAAAGAALRRFADEWRATGVYDWRLSRCGALDAAAGPRDLRPHTPSAGSEILAGRMALAGAVMEFGVQGDPWTRPCPSRPFAVELHRFSWLASLMSHGEAGAAEALRLIFDWERLFGRVSPFAWSAETLERRVFNLACALRGLSDRASDREGAGLLLSLLRQARHLFAASAQTHRSAERSAAAALAACALSGRDADRLAAQALRRLDAALQTEILPDGGAATRSPEQGLELLFDLLTLDDALLGRGRDGPQSLSRSIDRLSQAARFFTLGDGRLAAFQGGEAVEADHVAAALAHDDGEGRVMGWLPHAGYHRLTSGSLVVMVDAASPAEGARSLAACAQPLALEITCGADRLISNAGWSPDALGPQALRLTDAGSTASLRERSCGRLLSGFLGRVLGPRLVDGARVVQARRNENDEGVWLELEHDGWMREFGVAHERRLYLDAALDELRGEDRFRAADETIAGRQRSATFAIRFHLPADVQVSLARDQRSVLLRGRSNRGWWLRNDAPDVSLEPSLTFHNKRAQRGSQVVLKGRLHPVDGARVRWKLTPVEPQDLKGAHRRAREEDRAGRAGLPDLASPRRRAADEAADPHPADGQ